MRFKIDKVQKYTQYCRFYLLSFRNIFSQNAYLFVFGGDVVLTMTANADGILRAALGIAYLSAITNLTEFAKLLICATSRLKYNEC